MICQFFIKNKKNLFSYEKIKDVKYISLGRLSYQDTLFYHHYFSCNSAQFIEAPLLKQISDIIRNENSSNDLKLYASGNDELFFNSINCKS